MVDQRTPTPKKPEQPKPTRDVLKDFNTWAAGRTGLTRRELLEIYSGDPSLTDADRKILQGEIKKEEEAEKRTEEKRKADEAAKRKKEQEDAKKAEEKKKAEEEAKKKAAVKPGLVISRTKYPKWWKDLQVWAININGPGTWPVISKSPGFLTFIATIAFTVSDETNIVLSFGVFGASGAMDFGGEEEPRGMVIPMGESPAPCGEGGFTISSDGTDATVSGLVVYYQEKLEAPKAV